MHNGNKKFLCKPRKTVHRRTACNMSRSTNNAVLFVLSLAVLASVESHWIQRRPKSRNIPEVVTSSGVIRGQAIPSPLGGGVELEQFLGIPFALPPIGQRRFANPEPYGEFPGGVLEAFETTPSCMQIDTPAPPDMGPLSEDCLHLNVWRPRPVREGRAVLVWIFGGGFNVGSAMNPSSNGTMLATYGDVIVVAMNYRLNVFGFYHTGDDRMENGNFGLLDQQMALEWVQDNIAAFGGDPNLVTIFGSSAGGASVAHQLLLPGNQGLFTRAILQSGDSTADWAWDRLDSNVQRATQNFADNTNCTNDETLLDCLREFDGEELLSIYASTPGVASTPKIDGVTIRDHPETLLRGGDFIKVDTIIGYAQNEGSMFIYYIPGVTPDILYTEPWQAYITSCYMLASVKNQTQAEVDAIIEAYMPADNSSETVRVAIADMYGDNRFICPGEFSAKRFNGYGAKVYEFLLTFESSLANSLYPDWFGVPHGDDIQWVFGYPWFLEDEAGHQWTDEERIFSMEVMDRWVRFAKYGLPDSGGEWGPYTSQGPAYLELRGPADYVFSGNSSTRPDKCKLWRF